MSDKGDLRLLELDLAACFVPSLPGRFRRENTHDPSVSPRMIVMGGAAGNLAVVRDDIDDAIAERVLALIAGAPPWTTHDRLPDCLPAIVGLLSPENIGPGLIYSLPNGVEYDHTATIVRGDSAEGEDMLADMAAHGMPPSLMQAGFVDVSHFWPPWCAAMVGEEIAAMAFAARLSDQAAEIGVYTFAGFRGRGLAAAVTADWSALPSLKDHTLFYSTQTTNLSSQRVTARLGLRLIGVSLRLG